MSKNSNYAGTTQSLTIENRNILFPVFMPSKPVLDSELNLISDSLASKMQDIIRDAVPSGWLDANYSIGHDTTGTTYGINTTYTANTIYINSQKDTPSTAIVNGWEIPVGGVGVNDDTLLKLVLSNPPSSGFRDDLVFLEVWKFMVRSNTSTDGKPSATEIYKYGNTQYYGTNLAEEFINPAIGFETSDRIQIQYRIRTVDSVDFTSYPYGIDDINTVKAQGGSSSPVSAYTFINAGSSLDDSGLYIAGDGSSSARTALKTVDGYVYAIPMFRIHRRNIAAFSTSNQNGAGAYSVEGSTPSLRPDGLFANQIHELDIEDLRHAISFSGFDYASMVSKNTNDLFSGQLKTCLTESELESAVSRTNLGMYIDTIASSFPAATDNITSPNGQLRYFSDVASNIKVYSEFDINNKELGVDGADWVSSDAIKIEVKTPMPSGTILSATTPKIVANLSGVITTLVGVWSTLGPTTALFTLGINAGLTDENIHVSYDIDYPQKGFKFTKPLTEILRIYDSSATRYDWGWVSVNALDLDHIRQNYLSYTRRERAITSRTINGYSDYAYDYQINTLNGALTVVSYHMNGNGTQVYTLPGDIISEQDLLYVYAAYNVATGEYMELVSAHRDSTTFEIAATVPAVFNLGQTIRFDLVLRQKLIEYDERTSAITDMAKVEFYEKDIVASDTLYLEDCLYSVNPDDLAIASQGMYFGTPVPAFSSYCYLDDYIRACTVTIEANTNLVKIQFSGPVTGKVGIALLLTKTLQSLEAIHMYYNYYEYKGITRKLNFGTSSTSYIESKVMSQDGTLKIITNGTGAVNTAETLPKTYEPLISKLPVINTTGYEGNFTGTIHSAKNIIGGSYTITANPEPYTCGKINSMTKYGVLQDKGTYKGGKFTTASDTSDSGINKVIVSTLLEMVTDDGTGNFVPGELALKVETNCLSSTSTNRITNYESGSTTNSYDMFKIEGKPLIKVKGGA